MLRRVKSFRQTENAKRTVPLIIEEYGSRYDQIPELDREEYEDEPPSDYCREGYNLYLRLSKYKESELLFVHGKNGLSNNSGAERDARVYSVTA